MPNLQAHGHGRTPPRTGAARLAFGFVAALALAAAARAGGATPARAAPAIPASPAPAVAAAAAAEEEPLTCGVCHEEAEVAFAGGSHGVLLRTAKGDACASCHGPADPRHAESGGKEAVIGFSKPDPDAVARACAACHADRPDHARDWANSEYRAQGLNCAECHTVHERSDARHSFPAKDGALARGDCRICHAAVHGGSLASIHGKVVADPHLDSCQMCHAGGEAHLAAVRAKETPAGAGFGPVDCLLCHRTIPERHAKEMPAWAESRGAACTTCHRAHRPAAEAKAARALGPFADAAAAAGAAPVGEAACAACHRAPVEAFRGSSHGKALADRGAAACEACHGPGSLHAAAGGPARLVLGTRRLDGKGLARFCLACHLEKGPEHARAFEGSDHAAGGRTCASCHRVHAPAFDPAAAGAAVAVGSARCAECHRDPHPGLAESVHAPLLGKGRAGCESCHGNGSAHADSGGRRALVSNPGRLDGRARDAACLACHADRATPASWGAHPHARASVSCDACHDPFAMGRGALRAAEPDLCAGCHGVEAAQFRLPHRHPVPEGTMGCSSCHDPHRAAPPVHAAKRLADACAECHRAEATPRLFPHEADRADGCVACHEPHGSVTPRLLRAGRVTDLCLSCHIPPPTHDTSPGGVHASCLACHAEIHGSDADRTLLR
jgi:DmsE family decaheme c-type cytochrome